MIHYGYQAYPIYPLYSILSDRAAYKEPILAFTWPTVTYRSYNWMKYIS